MFKIKTLHIVCVYAFLIFFSCNTDSIDSIVPISIVDTSNFRLEESGQISQVIASLLGETFNRNSSDGPAERNPNNICRCEMRVDAITPVNYGSAPPWFLFDVTYSPNPVRWEFEGINNTTWRTNTTPAQNLPLPTPYTELETPSNGTHMFYIGSSFQSPPNFALGESVIFELSYKCQENNNTVPTTGTLSIDLATDTFDVGIFAVRGVFITLNCGEPDTTPIGG